MGIYKRDHTSFLVFGFALKMDIQASQDVKREDSSKTPSEEMPQLKAKGLPR